MSKLNLFYEMFFKWFFIGVKNHEHVDVEMRDLKESPELEWAMIEKERVEHEASQLAIAMPGVKKRTPDGIFGDPNDTGMPGRTTPVRCFKQMRFHDTGCFMEEKEQELIKMALEAAFEARVEISPHKMANIVREMTGCSICPWAAKANTKANSSWTDIIDLSEVASWDESDDKSQLIGIKIDTDEYALLRQSWLEDRESFVFEIDQENEDAFAQAYSPSGILTMNVHEFAMFHNSGYENYTLGETEDGESLFQDVGEYEVVSLDELIDNELHEDLLSEIEEGEEIC